MDSYELKEADVCPKTKKVDPLDYKATDEAKKVCAALDKYQSKLSLQVFKDECMYIEKKHFKLKTDSRWGVFRGQAAQLASITKASLKTRDSFMLFILVLSLLIALIWFGLMLASFIWHMTWPQRGMVLFSFFVLYIVVIALAASKQ